MSDAGTTMTIDEKHPHVKALTDAGIPIERLTALVNGSKSPITHESVTQQQELQTAANDSAAAQQLQALGNIQYIPPLDTQGFQQASELGPIFQQMLAGIVTPPVPNEPQFANLTPPTGQE
jgi:hypothetical protein